MMREGRMRGPTARRGAIQVPASILQDWNMRVQGLLDTSRYGSETMSTMTATHAHIAIELIDDDYPEVVVIEFLSREIVGAPQAEELGSQLDSLLYGDLPQNFVMDFDNVWSLGSTAFAEIADFVRKAWPVRFCNLDSTLGLGAALIGLEGRVEVFESRQAAIRAARQEARCDEEETVDYP
jgi:hypothetical protein